MPTVHTIMRLELHTGRGVAKLEFHHNTTTYMLNNVTLGGVYSMLYTRFLFICFREC